MAHGDVVWVELPAPDRSGHEQIGRRPALVVQDNSPDTPTLLVIPFTAQMAAARFPYTIQVEPSRYNGLSQTSILLVFQLRAIDRYRIRDRIGQLESNYQAVVDKVLRELLKLA